MVENHEFNKCEIFEQTRSIDSTNSNLLVAKKFLCFSGSRTYNVFFIAEITMMAAIGGFLFGYDTGVIGGAALYFHHDFPEISSSQTEIIVSLAVFGAAIGSLLIGPISDNYGRKPTIIISDLFFTLGAFLMFLSKDIPMLMAGRFFVGLGIGAASMVVPIYLAEISPTSIRGRIVTFNLMFVTSGQFIAYLIVLACGQNWRLMLGIAGIPAVLQLFFMVWFPESPKWMIKMERMQEAENIFKRIFNSEVQEGKDEMDREIKMIKESMEMEDVHSSQWAKYKELFTVYRKIVFIGVMLQVWQQLSGINTVMYYGPELMEQAGFGSENNELTSLYAVLPLSATNCIGTFIAILIVDKLGRRYIMLRTLPGCCLSMCLLGVSMILIINDYSFGQWIAALSLFTYVGFFAIGMGATPWTVNSEIYPLHLRGIGNSMATFGNWAGNYVISELFLTATDTDIGKELTYFVLGLFCFLGFLFIYILLPETKDRTIEENIKNIIPDLRHSIIIKQPSEENEGNINQEL